MNNVLSLFVGPQSQKLSYFLYNLEAEQIYDQETDPIDHSVIWRNVEAHTPRVLLYDFKNNISALEHINHSNNKKIIAKLEEQNVSFGLNYTDLQSQINQSLSKIHPSQSGDNKNNDSPIMKVFDNFTPLASQCIEINKYHADSQWVAYHSGEGIINTPEKMEPYSDPIRKQLEQEDFLEGFVFWADTFNGFGVFTEGLIDTIKDECPKKPCVLNCVYDSERLVQTEKQEEYQWANQLIIYSQLRQKVDMFIPFNIRPQLSYFQAKDQFSVYRSAAPLVSQFYTPFSLKNSMRFSNYVQSMKPFPWNTLFSAAYTVPIISEDKIQKGYEVFSYADFKQKNDLNCLIDLNEFKPTEVKMDSFSQSYVLRGPADVSKFEPHTHSLSLKILQNLFSVREPTLPSDSLLFSPQYEKYYGQIAHSFPYHSNFFSHQILKYKVKSVISQFEKCCSTTMSNYYRLGVQKDQFKEMRQDLQGLYDNYDRNGKQSDEDND